MSHRLTDVVDQAEKKFLIGIKKLPAGENPQDKTLRKLYTYTNGSAEVITNLIAALKSVNTTLRWTNDEKLARKSLNEIIRLLNQ